MRGRCIKTGGALGRMEEGREEGEEGERSNTPKPSERKDGKRLAHTG